MSKRRRNGIIVVFLLFVVLLVRLDHGAAGGRWRHRLSSQDQSQADQEKYHARTFKVIAVIDGDTIDIDVPDGAEGCTRIRLLGIDAPETRSEYAEAMYFGSEATEFARDLMLGQSATLYLDAPNPTRDKYGRLLAYLRLPDGRFANEVLLTEGFAYADTRFTHSLFNKYRQLEASARSRERGLWPNATPDQFPQWRRESTEDRRRRTDDRRLEGSILVIPANVGQSSIDNRKSEIHLACPTILPSLRGPEGRGNPQCCLFGLSDTDLH